MEPSWVREDEKSNLQIPKNIEKTEKSPLVVTDIKSTCGCTVPQGWSKEPLMPGASSQFSVKFNGKGANKTSKTITLTTNTQTGREQVRISAFITPDPNAPVVKKQ